MTGDKKRCKINIFGQEFTLVTHEPEQVLRAAHLLDCTLQELGEKASACDERTLMVLAAVRLAGALLRVQELHAQCTSKQQELATGIDKVLVACTSSSS